LTAKNSKKGGFMKNKKRYVCQTGFLLLWGALMACICPRAEAQDVLFYSNKNGTFDVWVMNPDGSNQINLSAIHHDPDSQFNEYGSRWSPDGKKIAFISNKGGFDQVWIMDSTGANERIMAPYNTHLAEYNPSWSPDGTKIFFSRNLYYDSGTGCAPCYSWEIFVHDLNSDQDTQLTFNSFRELEPVVSPDGNQIAYIKAENPNDCCNPTNIWIMDSDGQNQHQIDPPSGQNDGLYEWMGNWGRANDKILYGKNYSWGDREVVYIDPHTLEIVQVTNAGGLNQPGAFSPDGLKIIFVSNRGGQRDIWITNLDGSNLVQLTNDAAEEYVMDWKEVQNCAPIAKCHNLTLAADLNCQAEIDASDIDNGSFDPDGDNLTLRISPQGPYGVGEHAITLTATDTHGLHDSCVAKITIADVTSPVVQKVSALPGQLWPPNHAMVPVTISVVSVDSCTSHVVNRIVSVSSNEPQNGLGDGDTAPDWEITGPLTLNLRAERSGTGSGRIYTVTIESIDEEGNSATESVSVIVPKSKG
jgi:hypothetical protein